jgi:hypothetical protein
MAQITAVTEPLRAEARKWRGLADRAGEASRAAGRLTLHPAAFFIGDGNMTTHAQAYELFRSCMTVVLDGAATEFEQLGAAVDRVADAYDQADAMVAVDLDRIYRR